ncbi:TerB family tellurite resistance protein [Pedobacter sp.]|uniref:TerB family tellurite resistance protein n=1 Tax=Pedobacter sp. TaxID=1411316 RepID=UPI003BAB3B4A
MKTSIFRLYLIALLVFSASIKAFSQSHEAQQLMLNVEKLSQLKNILRDMKKGYRVLSKGYNMVKDISQGNYSLHQVFIDGLMLVSPEVRKYHRIGDILTAQKDMVTEYQLKLRSFKSSGVFIPREMSYLGRVYASLLSQSLYNLYELTMVITASTLRMNDEQRLQAIDRLYEDSSDKLIFLRSFNRDAALLMEQRKAAKADLHSLENLLINH